MHRALSILLLLLVACGNARYGGRVAGDGRAFFLPPTVEDQNQGSGVSVLAEPSVSLQDEEQRHTATFQPYFRADLQDPARTHLDLRQADYIYARGAVELGLGVGAFTWGVMDAHRPVDVVNQRDLVEDFEGNAKLGQPYVRLAFGSGSWTLEALALPMHRARTFPGEKGRLRGYLPVDSEPLYDQRLGALYPSAAARFSAIFGEVDFGVSMFSGIAREPRFLAQLTQAAVNARYERLHHVGLEVQWTHDSFALKLEMVARLWSEALLFSFAAAAGIEYTAYDLGPLDVVLVAEYHMDNRGPDQPFTLFQNDAFGGLRLAFHDEGGTAVTLGGLVDLAYGTTYARLSAERRLHGNWKGFIDARAFFGPANRLEGALRRDHFVQARVAYYFD